MEFLETFYSHNPNLKFGDQEDVAEILPGLLNKLHEEMKVVDIMTHADKDLLDREQDYNKYKYMNNSIIADLFHLQSKSTVACNNCYSQTKNEYNNGLGFITLYLPTTKFKDCYKEFNSDLEENLINAGKHNSKLKKAQGQWITANTQPEFTLHGCFQDTLHNTPEDFKCSNCESTPTNLTKYIQLPKYLIIQLSRFMYLKDFTNKETHTTKSLKRNNLITFPIHKLNLDTYMDHNINVNNVPRNYNLISVINHYGRTIETGHYTCYCKDTNDHKW